MWPLCILTALLVIISVVPGPAQLSHYEPMAALDECIPVMALFNLTAGKGKSTKGTWTDSMSSCLVGKAKGIWGLMVSESYCFRVSSATLSSGPSSKDLHAQPQRVGTFSSKKSREHRLRTDWDFSSRSMYTWVKWFFSSAFVYTLASYKISSPLSQLNTSTILKESKIKIRNVNLFKRPYGWKVKIRMKMKPKVKQAT